MRTIRYSRNEAGEIETAIESEQWLRDGALGNLYISEPIVYERSESIPQFYLLFPGLRECF